MAGPGKVWRDVNITFRGEAYTVTPSVRLLMRIEQDVSLSAILMAWGRGEPKVMAMSYVLAELLKAGGAKVTADDVMQEIAHNGQDGMALLAALVAAITPAAPDDAPSGE